MRSMQTPIVRLFSAFTLLAAALLWSGPAPADERTGQPFSVGEKLVYQVRWGPSPRPTLPWRFVPR